MNAMQNVLSGFQAGRQIAGQSALARAMPGAMRGDPGAISALAAVNPQLGMTMQQNMLARQSKQRTEALALAERVGKAITASPEEERPAVYKRSIQMAQSMGFDVSGLPAEYDEAAEAMAFFYAAPPEKRTDLQRNLELLPEAERLDALRAYFGRIPKAGTLGEKERIIGALPGGQQPIAREIATGIAPNAGQVLAEHGRDSRHADTHGLAVEKFTYDQQQDAIDNEFRQTKFEYGQQQDAVDNERRAREFAAMMGYRYDALDQQGRIAIERMAQQAEQFAQNYALAERRTAAAEAGKYATSVVNNVGPQGTNYGPPPKDTAWSRSPDGAVRLDDRGVPIALPIQGTKRFEDERGANREEGEADRALQIAASNYERKYQRVDAALNDAISTLESRGRIVAGAGSLLEVLPESGARDFARLIDTVKANLGFDELQAMRDSSPTGGALGQVTERELAFLQAVEGSLDTAQSPSRLLAILKDIKARRAEFAAERRRIMGVEEPQAGAVEGRGAVESLSDDEIMQRLSE